MKKTIFFIVAAVWLAACAPKQTEKAYEGVITFKAGNVTVNGADAAVGQSLNKSSEISVGEKSTAVIQFGTDANITLQPNTVLRIEEMLMGPDGKPRLDLAQSKGTTFSRVVTKGSDYQIRTATMVAGVRGTSFAVALDESNSEKVEIQLLSGEVRATKVAPPAETASGEEPAKQEEVVLSPGEKVVSDAKGLLKKETLSEGEKTNLAKLDEIKMVEKPSEVFKGLGKSDSATGKDSLPEVVPENIREQIIDKKLINMSSAGQQDGINSGESVASGVSLEDLKKAHGNVAQITTKSGKTYVGTFNMVGANMEIATPTGKVTVPNSDVASVKPYNKPADVKTPSVNDVKSPSVNDVKKKIPGM